jgi:hypothetical protein
LGGFGAFTGFTAFTFAGFALGAGFPLGRTGFDFGAAFFTTFFAGFAFFTTFFAGFFDFAFCLFFVAIVMY